jgi:hypothetical protein
MLPVAEKSGRAGQRLAPWGIRGVAKAALYKMFTQNIRQIRRNRDSLNIK